MWKQQGFGYLTVLFMVVVMSIGMTAATLHIDTVMKREREKELLFIGRQFQDALTSYYHKSPQGIKSLPTSLDELVDDKRSAATQHHLRKLYFDPMTQSAEWGTERNEYNQIISVYSLSDERFIKSPNTFGDGWFDISGVQKYSDMKFRYQSANPYPALATQANANASFGNGL